MRIVIDMYSGNKVFIKTGGGLIDPLITRVEVKQGCTLSPKLFNLFLNSVPNLFDSTYDPVKVSNKTLNVLMWADDLFLVSRTHTGLKECINRTVLHFEELGLKINTSKTKILIFNG